MLFSLFFSLLRPYLVGAAAQTTDSKCLPSTSKNELMFLDPESDYIEGSGLSVYPPETVRQYSGRVTLLDCCATMFTEISWSLDGVLLQQNNSAGIEFQEKGQVLVWTARTGNHTLICTAHGDKGTSVSHNISVFVFESQTLTEDPTFTYFPPDQCVELGSRLNLTCILNYGQASKQLIVVRKIMIVSSGPSLKRDDWNYYINLTLSKDLTIATLTLMFTNVTADYLNTNYTCMPLMTSHRNTVTFRLKAGPCNFMGVQAISRYTDPELAVKIAVPLVALALTASITAVLLVKYRTELRLWCKAHAIGSVIFSDSGDQYDVYMIYTESENHTVSNILRRLDLIYTLCLPERDFQMGAVIPEQLMERIKKSRCVVAILTEDMYKAKDWSDVSISLALQLNVKLVIIRVGELDKEWIVSKPDIAAVLNVGTVLDYPLCASDCEANKFFSALCDILPPPTPVAPTLLELQFM